MSFGLDVPQKKHFGLIEHGDEAWAARGETPLFPIRGLKIEGSHNAANALAAFALAEAAGINEAGIFKGLYGFPGLAHRCEWVADAREGCESVNDQFSIGLSGSRGAITSRNAGCATLTQSPHPSRKFLRRPTTLKRRQVAPMHRQRGDAEQRF